MLEKVLKSILGFSGKKSSKGKTTDQPQEKRPLSVNYDDNLTALKEVFNLCQDMIFREFKLNTNPTVKVCLVYVGPLTDHQMLSKDLIEALMRGIPELHGNFKINPQNLQQDLLDHLLTSAEVSTTSDLLELVTKVLQGNTALVLEGFSTAILAGTRGAEKRAVAEPDTEPVVRGPRDGFVESLDTNLSLVRRRIKTSRLKCEMFQVGLLTKTKVAVCYVQGIANDKVVEEVKLRISKINMSSVLGSNYIEELINDESFSLLPLIQYTERPDKTAGSLIEGRVGIIVDNSPMVLIVPTTFVTLLQAADDYYNNWVFATFVRLLRFVALNIALLLPSLIIAVFSFHQELVPTVLLTTAAGARRDLPFPIFLEILLMEVTFELLREAGVRLPKTVGQAISTVGGLVIGQAAVSAGFVSPLSVIVVAVTAIATFAIPNYAASTAIRILRFILIFLSGSLGGFGIVVGLMIILGHLCALRSFGVPYLSPIAPLSLNDLKDTMIRVPWWAMLTRPRLFGSKEPVSQDPDQGPRKPDKRGEAP